MMKSVVVLILLFLISINLKAQNDSLSGNFWHPNPRNYQVKHAVEIESLVPMFFTGGYHFALGYRYKKFRVRVSVINGGTYNAETAGIKTHLPNLKDTILHRQEYFSDIIYGKTLNSILILNFTLLKLLRQAQEIKGMLRVLILA